MIKEWQIKCHVGNLYDLKRFFIDGSHIEVHHMRISYRGRAGSPGFRQIGESGGGRLCEWWGAKKGMEEIWK